MSELSQRLIEAAIRWNINDYSLLFDQGVKSRRYSQKAMFRIGLWPIISNSDPEKAMAIGLILAALLEQWQSVCVYRLMAEVPDDLTGFEWTIDKSQFGVDDWESDGLDENIAVWGNFEFNKLSIEVENDAHEDDETFKLEIRKDSLTELINALPAIAEKIIHWIDPSIDRIGEHYKSVDTTDEDEIAKYLDAFFRWELHYYLAICNEESGFPIDKFESLVGSSQQMKSEFGAWILAQSTSRMLKYDRISWGQTLVSASRDALNELSDHPIFVAMICMTLFRLDYGAEVFDLLETNVSLHPENSLVWNTLATIYSVLREDLAALDTYQRAIESNAATSSLYRRYADLMTLLNNQQIRLKIGTQHSSPAGRPFVERYIYADSTSESANLDEASKAYRNAFEQNAEDLESLMQLVKCLAILGDDSIWDYCQKLVEVDTEGDITGTVIDQLPDNDIPFMIEILQKTQHTAASHLSSKINLARCYLVIGDYAKAANELAQIPKSELSQQNQKLVSCLTLAAQIPDFDTTIAEISDILDANGEISEQDIEFLEMLIEKDKAFSEGYGLLAKGYLSRHENDAALEVLLDCQNDAPFDAEATALLTKVLWDENQLDLAFAYLDKGLKQDKRNASLLSLKGRFLFDDGQDEDAKETLLLAEESDPLNSELAATRRYIANALLAAKKT